MQFVIECVQCNYSILTGNPYYKVVLQQSFVILMMQQFSCISFSFVVYLVMLALTQTV
jgi:hypothetical protein